MRHRLVLIVLCLQPLVATAEEADLSQWVDGHVQSLLVDSSTALPVWGLTIDAEAQLLSGRIVFGSDGYVNLANPQVASLLPSSASRVIYSGEWLTYTNKRPIPVTLSMAAAPSLRFVLDAGSGVEYSLAYRYASFSQRAASLLMHEGQWLRKSTWTMDAWELAGSIGVRGLFLRADLAPVPGDAGLTYSYSVPSTYDYGSATVVVPGFYSATNETGAAGPTFGVHTRWNFDAWGLSCYADATASQLVGQGRDYERFRTRDLGIHGHTTSKMTWLVVAAQAEAGVRWRPLQMPSLMLHAGYRFDGYINEQGSATTRLPLRLQGLTVGAAWAF